MPWTKSEVDKHKKGLTDKQKDDWVRIANGVYHNLMEQGLGDKEAAARAIRIANSKVG